MLIGWPRRGSPRRGRCPSRRLCGGSAQSVLGLIDAVDPVLKVFVRIGRTDYRFGVFHEHIQALQQAHPFAEVFSADSEGKPADETAIVAVNAQMLGFESFLLSGGAFSGPPGALGRTPDLQDATTTLA